MKKDDIEKTEDGKLILAFDEKYITPATIDKKIINWELLEKRTIEIEKNLNIVFSLEDGVSHITDLRKEISNSKTQLDDFRKKVKKYLETDSNKLNKKFVEYVNRYEKVRSHLFSIEQEYEKKALEEKKTKIQEFKTKLSEKLELKSLDKYLIDNSRWENKGFKLAEIEKEIEDQITGLNKKFKLIMEQLKAVNEEIENKIIFEDIEGIFNKDYDEIFKYIMDRKNQIKTTEENMLKKAEEDKQKAILEEQKKAEREKQKAIEEAEQKAREEEREKLNKNTVIDEIPKVDNVDEIQNNENVNYRSSNYGKIKKHTYITIQVDGLTEEATNDLLEVIELHELKYEKEVR